MSDYGVFIFFSVLALCIKYLSAQSLVLRWRLDIEKEKTKQMRLHNDVNLDDLK